MVQGLDSEVFSVASDFKTPTFFYRSVEKPQDVAAKEFRKLKRPSKEHCDKRISIECIARNFGDKFFCLCAR